MRWILALALFAGCFNRVADHCPGCVVLGDDAVAAPAILLVGGGFGFGEEWRPVIAALRERRLEFAVFEWPGPFRKVPRSHARLSAFLQRTINQHRRVLVVGHSAGGMIANAAARTLAVPAGHSLIVAAVASGGPEPFARFRLEARANTPLGMAVGGERETLPSLPPGVRLVEYREADGQDGEDLIHLGARVGHDNALAAALSRILNLIR